MNPRTVGDRRQVELISQAPEFHTPTFLASMKIFVRFPCTSRAAGSAPVKSIFYCDSR
jgi:hypothetical protein